jgi:hypothetical protein
MLAYFNTAMLWMYQIDTYALDLLAYLILMALVMHNTEWWKERKKAKSHTQAQNKYRSKTEVFLWSLFTYLV